MSTSNRPDTFAAFPSPLGWMAMIGSGHVLKNLVFGHASETAAIGALVPDLIRTARAGELNPSLVRRLQAYAAGSVDNFRDIQVDPGSLTDFQRRVVRCCRQIRFGSTLTYGQLAAKAGSPRAARAVGNCMAANRIPLVIPCHRVVAAGGGLGGYSAAGGIRIKQRLLKLEAGQLAK